MSYNRNFITFIEKFNYNYKIVEAGKRYSINDFILFILYSDTTIAIISKNYNNQSYFTYNIDEFKEKDKIYLKTLLRKQKLKEFINDNK